MKICLTLRKNMKQPYNTIIMSVCSPAKVPAHIAQANRSLDISDTQSQKPKIEAKKENMYIEVSVMY